MSSTHPVGHEVSLSPIGRHIVPSSKCPRTNVSRLVWNGLTSASPVQDGSSAPQTYHKVSQKYIPCHTPPRSKSPYSFRIHGIVRQRNVEHNGTRQHMVQNCNGTH